MQVLVDILPWLVAMAVLLACSAFFSASEAALFSLSSVNRRRLEEGYAAQRLAGELLERPDRLLSAVLFGNLLVNVSYFAVTAITSIQLERHPRLTPAWAVGFTLASLVIVIVLGEMLPKILGVLGSVWLSGLVSIPLAAWARIIDPLMPVLRLVNMLSLRMLWPRFEPEPSLELADLERAIELSTDDANLIEHEQSALRNIVSLSDLRVDECMRPRNQLQAFRPPVTLANLAGWDTSTGYLLITDPDSDEIARALNLHQSGLLPAAGLEREASSVLYLPWFVSTAEAWQRMLAADREVVTVVNEMGETIGVLTREDVLDIAFSSRSGRGERLLQRAPMESLADGSWRVDGITNLRLITERLALELPESHSVTIAGVAQECLQRVPAVGDSCRWGPLELEVLEHSGQQMVFRLRIPPAAEESVQ